MTENTSIVNPVDFICNLSYEDIPETVIDSARLCIMDATGCMIGGMDNQSVNSLAQAIAKKYPGTSRIAGTALTTTRPWAAFVNTHACSYFDMDDGHRKAQGHPGGIIVPVCLMLAAEKNLSSRELLTAVVIGYEIAVRSALIIREAGGPRKGSGGWSMIGAVAAAAKLSGLTQERVSNALGLAEYYTPQAPQDNSLHSPSSMKEGMAWAAKSTISITELAELDFDGMMPSLASSRHCSDLGSNWEISSTYFKMYACCRFAHPALDGLKPMVEDGIRAEDVEAVTVTSFNKAMLLNHLTPENPVAAMYSIPYIIASFLVNGKVGVEEMGDESLTNSQVLATAQKVSLVEDQAITDEFPLKCLARVSVRLKNGKIIEGETLSAQGDPDNPYSKEELEEKFRYLTRNVTEEKGAKLFYMLSNLENSTPEEIWQTV